MVKRIPEPKGNKKDSKGITLIGIEEKEKKEKEKELIHNIKEIEERKKLKDLKNKLTLNIIILFGYNFFSMIFYLYILIKVFTIHDVDFLNKYKRVDLIFNIETNILSFFFFGMFSIFFIHLINLIFLHKFLHKLVDYSDEIKKFGENSIVRRFTEILGSNEVIKFIIYFINVFFPLLVMLTIFLKDGKSHESLFYFIHSFLIGIITLIIIWFLYMNMETFDFGRLLDIFVWIILYIFASLFFYFTNYIYISLKFQSDTLAVYLSSVGIIFISLIILIVMKILLNKYPNFLNLGVIFLPVVVFFITILLTIANVLFVLMDNKPKNINLISSLIPKLEIYGNEFNKLYSDNNIDIKKKKIGDKIYISFKGIKTEDKINFLLNTFIDDYLSDENIAVKISESSKIFIERVRNLLSFSDKNFKFNRFINIYGEFSNLNNIKLNFAHLEYSILNFSQLQNISLVNAILKGVDLRYSIIKNVDFSESNLSNANLSYSILINPKFVNTDLRNTDFSYSVLINPVFISDKNDKTILENSNWENSIILFPKFCNRYRLNNKYITKCISFKETRNIESALIILDTKGIPKEYTTRFYYLNSVSDWYKKLKHNILKDKKNNKVLGVYFLYVLKLLKDKPISDKLIDYPYKRSIKYSIKILIYSFKQFLIKNKVLYYKAPPKEKESKVVLFKIPSLKLTEKQKNGLLVLMTIILMGSGICYFCKKVKL